MSQKKFQQVKVIAQLDSRQQRPVSERERCGRPVPAASYCSFVYSALAVLRMGTDPGIQRGSFPSIPDQGFASRTLLPLSGSPGILSGGAGVT
jgi:hypothetical protein